MTNNLEQSIRDLIEAEESPDFRKFVEMLPDSYWAKYDLSAVRLGWEAYKALHDSDERSGFNFDLYRCNADDSALFHLGKAGERKVIVLGLNPRTKDQTDRDTTLYKIEKTASLNGYDGFLLTHLYPLRTAAHYELPSKKDSDLMEQNIRAIEDVVGDGHFAFWCAWGKNIHARPYLIEALAQIREQIAESEWLHFGSLTKHGHPRHPSGLRYRWKFADFDIDGYLTKHHR